MNDILCRQLAADYCFSELDGHRALSRGFGLLPEIAVVNGKVLFTGKEKILHWCIEQYRNTSGEWFFEADNLRVIDDRIRRDGYRIKFVHPFYIADKISSVDTKKFKHTLVRAERY